jgi:DnaJ family protein A protein 5
MRCHYEVLDLDISATNDEIRQNYRRLALINHPDKVREDIDGATERFKEISAAYTTLSDPQERKWYDEHRDSILRGGEAQDVDCYDSPLPDLWRYFDASCYSGDIGTFYSVYSAVFREIASVEEQKSSTKWTSFGDENSFKESVQKFYREWGMYVSDLNFAWEDKYNPNDATNRAVRRLIDKDNKKSRETAKRKYQATVRALVAYIRKRDPRMAEIDANNRGKIEEQKEKKESEKANKALERKKKRTTDRAQAEMDIEEQSKRQEERQASFLLADQSSDSEDLLCTTFDVNDLEVTLGATTFEKNDEMNNSEAVGTSFECTVCTKSFKMQVQLEQHLKSKNHRKQAQEQQKASKKKGKSGQSRLVGEQDKTWQPILHRNEWVEVQPSVERAAEVYMPSQNVTEGGDADGASLDESLGTKEGHKCESCGQEFSTRNQLFHHLTASGHARPPAINKDHRKRRSK